MVLVAFACVFVVGVGMAAWFAADWTEEGSDQYPGGTVIRDSHGTVLRVALGAGDVDCRPYYRADREDWVVKALVASEDGDFWHHHGVRPLSALRATFQNVVHRRRVSGASTITMQAVRLIHPHPKSLWWKMKEAVLAVKMEQRKDKLWILSQYLNRAPMGSNFIGIEAAANGWFGKGAKDLGPGEAAMLAGMVQAPSRYRPDRWMNRALARRRYVLKRMIDTGVITPDQAKAVERVLPVVCRSPRPFRTPYFCDWVQQMDGGKSGDVATTLNADVQQMAEQAVNRAAAAGGWSVAAVVMRVDSGAVLAMACSGNYFAKGGGQVNTALAPRPAGSTLKPLLMAQALDRGLVTPEERLADMPINFKGYTPANFDGKYRGSVTAQDALVLSLNIPFVQLLQKVEVASFGGLLRSIGFNHMNEADEQFGLGMAIGNVECSLVELVAAYGTLARSGVYRRACALRDEVEGRAVASGTRVFSDGAAYLVSEMLSGDERSLNALGHVADVAAPRFAWKTGTSAGYRDAWTVAWNPEYVIGVWCGHLSGNFGDQTIVGAHAASPLAWKLIRSLYPSNSGPWFVEPGDVARRRICALTGKPANPDCPVVEEGRYLRAHSSHELCAVHARGADGRLIVRQDSFLAAFSGKIAHSEQLRITKPENDATFCLVQGMPQQRVVCTVAGNVEGGLLWWFVDGVPAGETKGADAFAWAPTVGEHVISCTTQDGVTASVAITVRY